MADFCTLLIIVFMFIFGMHSSLNNDPGYAVAAGLMAIAIQLRW